MNRQAASQTHQEATAPAMLAGGLLQRKCDCGQHTIAGGECSSCSEEREGSLQRSAINHSQAHASAGVPPVVHEVLRSPGQPLDQAARNFFEPRFGHDFSRVRVHTDARAAESAHEISALAYTVGSDLVFGAGQYRPDVTEGRKLMAHELAHVVQQGGDAGTPTRISDPGHSDEQQADHAAHSIASSSNVDVPRLEFGNAGTIWRTRSGLTNCPANTNSAPADPAAALDGDDARAQEIATTVADLTRATPPDAQTVATYRARFGSPPAVGKGFMNRLTGSVRATEDIAVNEELRILSRRFRIIARFFSQPIPYRCIGGASNFGGCAPPNCDNAFAWSCRGVGAIFLCPDYWNGTDNSEDERAAVLVHESFHVNFGESGVRQIGEVGDATLQGSGRNFVVADCYSGFAADLVGITNPADSCPNAP
jgi:hypothetical protein